MSVQRAGFVKPPQIAIDAIREMAECLEIGDDERSQNIVLEACESWAGVRGSSGYQLLLNVCHIYDDSFATTQNPFLQRQVHLNVSMQHTDKIRALALKNLARGLETGRTDGTVLPRLSPMEEFVTEVSRDHLMGFLTIQDQCALRLSSSALTELCDRTTPPLDKAMASWHQLNWCFQHNLDPRTRWPNLRVVTSEHFSSPDPNVAMRVRSLYPKIEEFRSMVGGIPISPEVRSLTHLECWLSTSYEERLQFVANNTQLTFLNVFGIDAPLCEGLSVHCKQLRTLVAYGNEAISSGFVHLSKLPNLTKVDLSNCEITDVALPAFSPSPSLQHIRLNGNPISDEGLLEFVIQCPQLLSIFCQKPAGMGLFLILVSFAQG